MTDFAFRPLRASETKAALAIIAEVTDWLLSKGIRQWMQPVPVDIYRARQKRGENFGLWIDGDLAAVVSLLDERPPYWAEYLPETPFKWMATLASSRRYKGQGLGQVILGLAEEYLTGAGVDAIYLDCIYGQGTLPEYYASLGYEQVVRKAITFPIGTVDSVLMRKSLKN